MIWFWQDLPREPIVAKAAVTKPESTVDPKVRVCYAACIARYIYVYVTLLAPTLFHWRLAHSCSKQDPLMHTKPQHVHASIGGFLMLSIVVA